MKRKIFTSRYVQVLSLLLVLAIILGVRLFIITVIQNDKWSEASEDISTRSIYTTAPRGEIYDRYGNLLAGNKQSFSVRMSGTGQSNSELNANIVTILGILEGNGDSYSDEFPIKIENGELYYTYETEIASWLEKKGLSTDLTAEEAFDELRNKLGIDPSLDRYAAQLEIQNTYNQYPPISVKQMKYTAEIKKEQFLQTYFGNDKKAAKYDAKEAFAAIREKMEIDKSLSDEEARKIMVIRNDIKSLGYNQYMPAVIAKNVSEDTVMLIEERGESLKGVDVVSETVRYYPNGNFASHILGYMGKITDEEKTELVSKGYENGAVIGKEGIEGKYESVLKGTNGEEKVQVNAKGELQSVISKTDPIKGKDIYLTIDAGLQTAAEDGLEKSLKAMRSGGTVTSEYGNSNISKVAPKAETGAVVAIEVETGDVLAMASYPDYDPNLFSEGISQEDWESLQSANLRDPLSPAPLYNLATMSTVQPGSTFKPVTATAGLECGLNPTTKYMDGGYINLGGTKFGCVVWNLFGQNHGPINLARALEVSCNYYFFDIATGKDWYTGNSLGYNKKITVDTITEYAKQYGLGLPTGIEINEAVVPVPSKERKIDALKTSFGYELYAGAEEYFTEKVVKNPEQLDKNIAEMKSWMSEEELSWEELYEELLPKLGVREEKRQKVGEMFLYNYYPQAKWTTGDAFNISIGQGENSYTPLQMANYIATLGNDGVHNKVSLVKTVADQGAKEKEAGKKIDISDDKYLDYIIEGMVGVANGSESTVSTIFGNMEQKVAAKTGTAERAGKVNPPSEVEYVKSNLGSIAPSLSWGDIETEMKRLMKEYPKIYTSEDTAVRRAVQNVSGGTVTSAQIDANKGEYENFAWVVAMAPADDPKIAVCAMVPQGSTAANAAPIVKEVLGKYFDTKEEYTDFTITNVVE